MRAELRAEAGSLRGEMQDLRAEMQAGFARIDARFDAMQRLMIAALLTIVLGFIVDKV